MESERHLTWGGGGGGGGAEIIKFIICHTSLLGPAYSLLGPAHSNKGYQEPWTQENTHVLQQALPRNVECVPKQ